MPGFIIDLDGTMYAGSSPIRGAAAFVSRLKAARLPYLYATNNSSRRPEQVALHLQQVSGVSAGPEEVVTSAQAAARYAAGRKPGATVYAIGEEGLLHALEEAGLVLADEGEAPDYVIQGIDRSFTYDKLTAAVRFIRQGAAYILTNPDRLLPGDGGLMPGAGSLSEAISAASGMAPVIIGKPSPILLDMAVERLGLPRDDIWVVGDNLLTDIEGGYAAGCRTALVLTGVTTADNVGGKLRHSGIEPDLVCRDLLELWDRING